ncbi:MAG: response regulator transcription factor [Aliarcobacter sp.]|jgi:DNA-binding response OmpR family regulator|nr:response regulator transcription factor [Aliarcobacter sp.]
MIDYISLEKYAKEISILFVEDDKGISKKMEILLYEIFSKIEIAFDGNEALEKYYNFYKANNEYPDLIITDIRMPNMDGIELIKHIYKENANQKIIVLSAHNESEYLMELVNLGIYRFILKPMDYNNFFEIIFKVSKEIYMEKYKVSDNKEIFIKLNCDLIWNKELKQLYLNDKLLKLTKKEFLLIELLLRIPEKIFVNEEIISYIWKEEFNENPDISNLKNLISRLRSKIPALKIDNIYGFGYKIVTI